MKRIILWLIRKYADDRNFRINICKELHHNAQNYYGEQTGPGRFYEACGEFFEAAPNFMVSDMFDYKRGVMNQFEETKEYIKNNPKKFQP